MYAPENNGDFRVCSLVFPGSLYFIYQFARKYFRGCFRDSAHILCYDGEANILIFYLQIFSGEAYW